MLKLDNQDAIKAYKTGLQFNDQDATAWANRGDLVFPRRSEALNED